MCRAFAGAAVCWTGWRMSEAAGEAGEAASAWLRSSACGSCVGREQTAAAGRALKRDWDGSTAVEEGVGLVEVVVGTVAVRDGADDDN